MPRPLRVAAIQVGRVDRCASREDIIPRLIKLLEEAAAKGVKLAVFPETTFTTFFPRTYYSSPDDQELAACFDVEEDSPKGIVGCRNSSAVQRFFAKAAELDIDVVVGYAEQTPAGQRYNTATYVSSESGLPIGKYRKIHLPGTVEPFSKDPIATNQLEKRYFLPGNLGFNAFRAPSLRKASGGSSKSPIIGMLICNDRRWAEGWRVYGLQGVEIMCIGYNTTAWAPELWGIDPDSMTRQQAYEDAMFHHKLVCQAHAYTNSTFLITSARCGVDDGLHPLISGSMIVDPEGHIVAENKTEGDEVVVADIDIDAAAMGKGKTFAFEKHRRIEHYTLLTERRGVVEPGEPSL